VQRLEAFEKIAAPSPTHESLLPANARDSCSCDFSAQESRPANTTCLIPPQGPQHLLLQPGLLSLSFGAPLLLIFCCCRLELKDDGARAHAITTTCALLAWLLACAWALRLLGGRQLLDADLDAGVVLAFIACVLVGVDWASRRWSSGEHGRSRCLAKLGRRCQAFDDDNGDRALKAAVVGEGRVFAQLEAVCMLCEHLLLQVSEVRSCVQCVCRQARVYIGTAYT
jgi:hypothetical protein